MRTYFVGVKKTVIKQKSGYRYMFCLDRELFPVPEPVDPFANRLSGKLLLLPKSKP